MNTYLVIVNSRSPSCYLIADLPNGKAMIPPKLLLWWLTISAISMPPAFSQSNTPVSLEVVNKPIKDVAYLILKKTGYALSGNILAQPLYLSVSVNNLPPREAIKAIFKNLAVTITYSGYQVILENTESSWWQKVEGYVTNEKSEPLGDVTVKGRLGNRTVTTNAIGFFSMWIQINDDSLEFSHINALSMVLPVPGERTMSVILSTKTASLDKVEVSGRPNAKELRSRAPASKEPLDLTRQNNKLVVSLYDFLKINGGGILVQDDKFYLRGLSTINSDQRPLFILNGFPFEGNLRSINPADIEEVTLYKDAMAASVWGPRASNGIIATRTKTGYYKMPLQISIMSNIAWRKKTNILEDPGFLASNYVIDVEKWLFQQGYYDNALENRTSFPAVSPVVEILEKERRRLLSPSQVSWKLDSLRQYDVKRDLQNFYYQDAMEQQFSLSLQEGDSSHHMHLSIGCDLEQPVLLGNFSQRYTASLNHVQMLKNYKMEIGSSLLLGFHSERLNNTGIPNSLYAYQSLADRYGRPLAVTKDYRDGFTDTAGGGKLLNWKYSPLEDLQAARITQNLNDVIAAVYIRKSIKPQWHILLSGQWQSGKMEREDLKTTASYYTRNLINLYSQIQNERVNYQIPYGNIRDLGVSEYQSLNGNLQMQFVDSVCDNQGKCKSLLTVTAGADMSTRKETSAITRQYRYNKDFTYPFTPTNELVPLYLSDQSAPIPPTRIFNNGTFNNVISAYATGSWLIRNKLSFSGTLRRDASNLFGREVNNAAPLLWALGAGWQFSEERLYPWKKIFPYLNFRLTQGITGNVNNSISSLTMAHSSGLNLYGQPVATITNPPNPLLRPEKTKMTNIGLELATKGNWLQIRFEYFLKTSSDLVGAGPIDYTTGVIQFFGNTANMKGKGFDLNITARYGKKELRGLTSLVLNQATDRVTKYLGPQGTVGSYLQPGQITPLAGRPYFALHSVPTAGLDPQTGKLYAKIDGHPSLMYDEVTTSTDLNQYLVLHGSSIPTTYGNWYNSLSWRGITLAATIGFKLNYYFRRSSINYSQLATNQQGHMDFVNRWQVPGDELTTHIPSLSYPLDRGMDDYYQFSDLLVTKGDHIRLMDCNISYQVPADVLKRIKIKYASCYLYANDLGILWRANHQGIDPDYPDGKKPGILLGAGIKLGLTSK